MNFDFLKTDDRTGQPSDTTKRAWFGFGFILFVGLALLIIMLFIKVSDQVLNFFYYLSGLLGLTGPGAYSLKRVTEKPQEDGHAETHRRGEEEVSTQMSEAKREWIVEGIVYNSQRDNKINPSIACNVTATQMFMQGLLKVVPTDDDLMEFCNSSEMKTWAKKNLGSWTLNYAESGKLNQVHAVLAEAVNVIYGKDICKAVSGLDIDDVQEQIRKGYPVVLGGLFVRLKNGKLGGHMVCCIGYNSYGLIINDPWGNWNTNYIDHDGEKKVYEYSKLKNVLSGNGIVRI